MPVRSREQKCPGNVVWCAVHVVQIATGEIKEELGKPRQPNKAIWGRTGGKCGQRYYHPSVEGK